MFAILPRYWRDKESILIIKSVFSAFVNVQPTFQQAIEENFNFTIESFRFEDESEYEYEISLNLFVRVLKKTDTPKSFSLLFKSPKKLVRLFILKQVKPSPDSRMIKLLTFDYWFLRMTTATTFSRQNDAVSRLSSSQRKYRTLVVLVSESKALQCHVHVFPGI